MARKRLSLSVIEPAPPYNLTVGVVSARNVRMLGDVLKNGNRYPEPIICRYGKKCYPVGNLDTLEAAKAVGMKEIDCIVEDVDNINAVAKMHISHSRHTTYNPISLISMVRKIEESGGDLSTIPVEMQKISKLNLDDNVKTGIDKFITELGKKNIEVPSFLHILIPLSNVENGRQGRVLSDIIQHTTVNGDYVPPSNNVLMTIIKKHTSEERRKISDGKKTVRVDPEPEADDETDDTPREDVGVDVKKSKESGIEMSPSKEAVEYTCTSCVEKIRNMAKAAKKRTVHVADIGACTSKYLINFNNSKIKELSEGEENVTAVEAVPEPLYAISSTDAKFLELEMGTVIHSYRMGGRGTGHTVILTKKKLNKDKRDAILAIINGN